MSFQKLDHNPYPESEMIERSTTFFDLMIQRRTIRDFSDRPIPIEIIENAIQTASSAPSGANKQPWHFVIVKDPVVKKDIRIAAEKEEKEFYSKRAPKEWLEALLQFGTDDHKPYLEIAPYLIIDPVAHQFMDGATIDYDTSGMSPTFIFSDVFKGQGGTGMCGGCGGAGH